MIEIDGLISIEMIIENLRFFTGSTMVVGKLHYIEIMSKYTKRLCNLKLTYVLFGKAYRFAKLSK